MFRLYFVLVAALLLATNLVSTNASKENADERTSFNSIASFIREYSLFVYFDAHVTINVNIV